MSTRRLNIAIWVSAACLACGAVAVLAVGFFAPLGPIGTERGAAAGGRPTSQPAVTDLPSIDSFDLVLHRPLRVALTDAAATPPAAMVPSAANAPTPPPLVFVGSIGKSLAMIKTADGSVAVKGVGEQVDGADVVAIRPTQVDIRIGGKIVTLEKPAETSENP